VGPNAELLLNVMRVFQKLSTGSFNMCVTSCIENDYKSKSFSWMRGRYEGDVGLRITSIELTIAALAPSATEIIVIVKSVKMLVLLCTDGDACVGIMEMFTPPQAMNEGHVTFELSCGICGCTKNRCRSAIGDQAIVFYFCICLLIPPILIAIFFYYLLF
jgi:hypothetical protein